MSGFAIIDGTPTAEVQYQQAHINDSRQAGMVANIAIWQIATVLIVGLRITCRRWKRISLGMDDFVILVGLILLQGYDICEYLLISVGHVGRHTISITEDEWPALFKLDYVSGMFNDSAWPLSKISLCFLYLRIFSPIPTFRYIVWTFTGFVTAAAIAKLIALSCECRPLSAAWSPVVYGTCFDYDKYYTASGALNISIDFITLLLPIPLVWKLQMNRSRRWAIIGLFGLGLITCLLSVMRTVYINYMQNRWDIWWDRGPDILFICEIHLSYILACLPTIMPIFEGFARAIRSITGSHLSSSAKRSSGYADQSKGNGYHDQLPLSSYGSGPKNLGSETDITGKDDFEIKVKLPSSCIEVQKDFTWMSEDASDRV